MGLLSLEESMGILASSAECILQRPSVYTSILYMCMYFPFSFLIYLLTYYNFARINIIF